MNPHFSNSRNEAPTGMADALEFTQECTSERMSTSEKTEDTPLELGPHMGPTFLECTQECILRNFCNNVLLGCLHWPCVVRATASSESAGTHTKQKPYPSCLEPQVQWLDPTPDVQMHAQSIYFW